MDNWANCKTKALCFTNGQVERSLVHRQFFFLTNSGFTKGVVFAPKL